jgi:hypothetical protein
VILPLDAAFALRLDVALRLFRRTKGQPVLLLPLPLRLTPQHRVRLIQLLHAFDVYGDGGDARAVAKEVLRSDQASLPSTEWKDSAARRKAMRLIKDATDLVKHGYLKLLRGGFR